MSEQENGISYEAAFFVSCLGAILVSGPYMVLMSLLYLAGGRASFLIRVPFLTGLFILIVCAQGVETAYDVLFGRFRRLRINLFWTCLACWAYLIIMLCIGDTYLSTYFSLVEVKI